MSDRDDDGIWFGPEGDEEPEDSPFRERFEALSRDEAEYHKIFSELGFTFVDDGCGGTCPICENRKTCPVYPELKAEWEALAADGRRSPPHETRRTPCPRRGRRRRPRRRSISSRSR